jgi:cyclic beta-1,2-glucan synthetase
MYRLGIEGILGIERAGQALRINPVIPRTWAEYTLTYRYGRSVYEIVVKNPEGICRGVKQISLDGEALPDGEIFLEDDSRRHEVEVVLGVNANVVKEVS